MYNYTFYDKIYLVIYVNISSIYLSIFKERASSKNDVVKAIDAFKNFGFIVYAEEWICDFYKLNTKNIITNNIIAADIVVSIGGDGTLLIASQLAIKYNKPLLGINSGKLGFLTEFDLENISDYLYALKSGDFFIEERMLLKATINNENSYIVVNDVVISRGGYSRLVMLEAYVDEDLISKYFADGIIVSSPTGSTGYSLSAGGPIVSPDIEGMIVTPICAHSIQIKPVLINANKTIKIKLNCDRQQEIQISIDGKIINQLACNSIIEVTKSENKLKLLRVKELKFFTLVRNKLSEWSK